MGKSQTGTRTDGNDSIDILKKPADGGPETEWGDLVTDEEYGLR